MANNLGLTTRAETIVPIPVVGLEASWAITPRWFLKGGSDFFYIEYGDYKGYVLDAIFALEYDFHDHAGVGLSFNYVDMDLEVDADEFLGELNYSYGTILAYLKLFI